MMSDLSITTVTDRAFYCFKSAPPDCLSLDGLLQQREQLRRQHEQSLKKYERAFKEVGVKVRLTGNRDYHFHDDHLFLEWQKPRFPQAKANYAIGDKLVLKKDETGALCVERVVVSPAISWYYQDLLPNQQASLSQFLLDYQALLSNYFQNEARWYIYDRLFFGTSSEDEIFANLDKCPFSSHYFDVKQRQWYRTVLDATRKGRAAFGPFYGCGKWEKATVPSSSVFFRMANAPIYEMVPPTAA